MDGLDSGPPSRIHFLGTIRKEPGDDGGQREHEIAHGAEGGPGRTSLAGRAVAVSPVWADGARRVCGPQSTTTTLSLPRCTAESRRGSVHFLWELAAGPGGSPGGARSHRRQRGGGCAGSDRADAAATGSAPARGRDGTGAGSLRSTVGGATVRSRRSGATVGCGGTGSALECGLAEGTRCGEEAAGTGERPAGRCDSVQGGAVEFGAGPSGRVECSLHGHA